MRRLKRSGCDRIHLGVEAGTEKILEVLNKRISIERAVETFRICHDLGFETLAYFMIGAPGETRADIEQSLRLALKLNPDYVHVTVLAPYPETEIYRRALETGLFEEDYLRDFALSPRRGLVTRYWEETFTREELFDLLDDFYKRYCARPRYVMRNLLKIRSIVELKRKAKAGSRLLGLSRVR